MALMTYCQSKKKKKTKILVRNGSAPFLLGSKLSIGDLKLTSLLNWIKSGHIEGVPKDLAVLLSSFLFIYDSRHRAERKENSTALNQRLCIDIYRTRT